MAAHSPVFLPGESRGQGSLVGCRLWGRTESDMTERAAAAAASGLVVKNPPAVQKLQKTLVRYLGWEDPLEEWQPTPVFLPGESHGQWSLAGYSPEGHKESDHD